jgi:flagellar hook-associated protein 1 FlgK
MALSSLSSLNTSLINSLSGLRAGHSGIETVSRNVGNANSEFYTRKIQSQLPNVVGGLGQGVNLPAVTREVDLYLQRDSRDATSRQERLKAIDEYLSRLEKLYGQPGDTLSLGGRLSALRASFEDLTNHPDNLASQTDAYNKAIAVKDQFNSLTTNIQAFRTQIEQEISNSVTNINTALSAIGTLNTEIAKNKNGGVSTADLEDQRDMQVAALAKEMGVQTFVRADGRLAVLTESSRFLLDQTATTASFTQKGAIVATDAYVPTGAPAAGFNATLNGVTIPDPAGGAAIDITSSITRGRLAGLFSLRDTVLPQSQAQLDEQARRLTLAFEGTGTGYAGTAITLFTDTAAAAGPPVAAFTNTAANTVGYAGRITTNPILATAGNLWRLRDGTNSTAVATESTFTGDQTQLRSVLTMFETAQTYTAAVQLGTSNTVEAAANNFTGFQATQTATYKASLDDQTTVTEALKERLRDQSGVNVDDELGRMIQLQNSYSASARVMTTVTQMLDDLLRIGT